MQSGGGGGNGDGGRHSTGGGGRVFKNKRPAGATVVRGRRRSAKKKYNEIIKTILFSLPLRARSRPTSSAAAAALAARRDIGGPRRKNYIRLGDASARIPVHAALVPFRDGVRARSAIVVTVVRGM